MRQLIRWSTVSKGVPFTRQHILRLEKAGRFPKRLKLGDNSVAWFADEIKEWQEELAKKRDNDSSENFGDELEAIASSSSSKSVGAS